MYRSLRVDSCGRGRASLLHTSSCMGGRRGISILEPQRAAARNERGVIITGVVVMGGPGNKSGCHGDSHGVHVRSHTSIRVAVTALLCYVFATSGLPPVGAQVTPETFCPEHQYLDLQSLVLTGVRRCHNLTACATVSRSFHRPQPRPSPWYPCRYNLRVASSRLLCHHPKPLPPRPFEKWLLDLHPTEVSARFGLEASTILICGRTSKARRGHRTRLAV